MPLDDLARFGVSEEMLLMRQLTPEIIEAIKYQIARVRDLQAKAEAGIEYLDPISRPCIRAASELYCGIVDEIEANGYDIFNKRASTSQWRRMRVAGSAFIQTLFIRMR
jgi:phytoene synthase